MGSVEPISPRSWLTASTLVKLCASTLNLDLLSLLCRRRVHGHPLQQQRSGLPHAPGAALPHNWGYDDDALLAAMVVEYNNNWHFIADTCSSTSVLQVRYVGYCHVTSVSVRSAVLS